MSQLDTLLPDCVLPGCRQPVATVGEPCDGCRAAFGDMLQHNPVADPMTAEQIHERDHGTRHAQAIMAEIARHRTREDGEDDVGEPGEQRVAECWQCEQDQPCDWTSMGWECPSCAAAA
ncbi:hypothetical protein GS532_17505 [Rhodococcus hoagii]|nr:hypothetical protein [Prescottella equi]NKU31573.1 hypothetical protein [Prescottella equi]NKV19393.1 hypothetical protein [Prescottella equi]NKV67927.1 hypothetical protein [Prescottella equi]